MAVAECKIIRKKASVGVADYVGLSDTQGSLTANRIIHTNAAGTALTDSNVNILSTGELLIGTTSQLFAGDQLDVVRNVNSVSRVILSNSQNGTQAVASIQAISSSTILEFNANAPLNSLFPGRGQLRLSVGALLDISTTGASPITLSTSGIERLRILSGANTLQFNSGGTVQGGATANDNLTLSSTANATKGKILFGISAYDEVNDRLGVGTNVPNARVDVRGVAGASVGGFASGSLHVTSSSALINANAVITGHNLFGGNKQLWYLGSVSSSNDNIAFINRQTGSLALQTSNSLVTLLTGSSNTLQGNGGLKLQGGAGIFTLTLSGGTGLASTLKLQEVVTDKLSAYGVAGQAQAAKIADPSGGATVDAEARTAVDKIIDVLEGIGFSAAA